MLPLNALKCCLDRLIMLRRRLFVPRMLARRYRGSGRNMRTVSTLRSWVLRISNGDVGQFDADAGLRNVLKVLRIRPLRVFRAIQRKVEAEHAVDVTQGA